MDLLIKNGRVVDPARKLDSVMDVLIRDGKIRLNGSVPGDAQIFDAEGLVVAPGFFDIHVHLREPGTEEAETIATGGAAAVAGGFRRNRGDAEHKAFKRQSVHYGLHHL